MEGFNIGVVAGVILSLLFKYIPGLSGWFDEQEPARKEQIMLGIMTVTVAGAYGLSCLGWLDIYACGPEGLKQSVFALIGAVLGNQGAYSMLSNQKQ